MMRYSVMVFVGLVAIVTGLVVFFLMANATRNAILDELVIDSEAHKNYQDWLTDTDADDQVINYNYYFFNLSNPSEWASGADDLPVITEHGPYSYRRYINKESVSFGDGGNEVSFTEKRWYTFQSEKSGTRAATDNIFSFNPFYYGILATAGSETNLGLSLASGALNAAAGGFSDATAWGTTAIQSTSGLPSFPAYMAAVRGTTTIALTAAESTILTTLQNVTTLAGYATSLAQAAAGSTDAQAALVANWPTGPDFGTPVTLANGNQTTKAALVIDYVQFIGAQARTAQAGNVGANGGLVWQNVAAETTIYGPNPLVAALASGRAVSYGSNDTSTGEYTVKTGKDVASFAGMDFMTKANGKDISTAYVGAPGASQVDVNGRSQTMDPFQGATPDKISVYFEELERYASFTFNGVQEVEEIETARYVADIKSLVAVNAAWNISNQGYAPIGYWTNGLPLYISAPHGGYAGSLKDTVSGQSYNKDSHNTYLDLEPITGLPLQARLAVQVNVLINVTAQPLQDIPSPKNQETMLPIYYLSREFRISAESAKSLRKAVVTAVVARRAILGSLVGLGVVCVLIGAALMVQKGGNEGTGSGNEGVKDAAPVNNNKSESKPQESELPPDNEPELQPFNPPPAVHEEGDDKEMQPVGPQ